MLKNNKGQTLYYFLIFTLILVISWAMMLNIAKLIRTRMTMQNDADSFALSLAVHKARTMNMVANLNYLIGSLLAMGTVPNVVQIPSYNTDNIASYITGDYEDGFYAEEDDDVETLKKWVDNLQDLQEAVLKNHILYADALRAQYISKGYYANISSYPLMPSADNAEKLFGLKRNSKGIKYIKTINSTIEDVHFVYNPYPIYLGDALADALSKNSSNGILYIVSKLISFIDDNMPQKEFQKKEYSWYITDNEKFYKQKIKVSLTDPEFLNSGNSDGLLFKSLLSISKPLITVFSAASIYNTKGTMFPDSEGTNTGTLKGSMLYAYDILFIAQSAKFLSSLNNWKLPPYVIAAIAAYITSEAALSYMTAAQDKNNPIDSYLNARSGGWAAHIVAYKNQDDGE
ncbi:MAG: hypothetical protein LBQ47_07270 [Endomicrobium sp.]|jgi:hypothetical protein|nr:hypothetical protein [Endomicrobium sp.]